MARPALSYRIVLLLLWSESTRSGRGVGYRRLLKPPFASLNRNRYRLGFSVSASSRRATELATRLVVHLSCCLLFSELLWAGGVLPWPVSTTTARPAGAEQSRYLHLVSIRPRFPRPGRALCLPKTVQRRCELHCCSYAKPRSETRKPRSRVTKIRVISA